MQVQVNNERERLVLEQALLAYREVEAAGEAARHGQGMATLEDATLETGRRQMRLVLEQALESRAAAQKRGAVARDAVGLRRSSGTAPRR